MGRVYNFSAGPAVLPEEVLKEAAAEMLDYNGSGMSVMEMSHRSKVYDEIIKTAEKDLRDLMNIPDNYKVLFLQGGASQQFAMIPMNLMKNKKAAYIVTGQWAKKAYQEAGKYGEAIKVASSEDKTFSYIPDCSDLDIPEDADPLDLLYIVLGMCRAIESDAFKDALEVWGKQNGELSKDINLSIAQALQWLAYLVETDLSRFDHNECLYEEAVGILRESTGYNIRLTIYGLELMQKSYLI